MNWNKARLEESLAQKTIPASWMNQASTWVLPYIPGFDALPEELVPMMYMLMKRDGTLTRCLEGPASESLAGFVNFFSRPDLSLIVAYDSVPNGDTPIAIRWGDFSASLIGAFWLSTIVQAGDGSRGSLGFFFAKEYWQPQRTELVGRMALNLWFNSMRVSLVTAWCLSEDRLARRYLARLGFRRAAEVAGYGKWGFQPCPGLLYTLHQRDLGELPCGDTRAAMLVDPRMGCFLDDEVKARYSSSTSTPI